jgi:Fur family ferric uptake transcriptional regulator
MTEVNRQRDSLRGQIRLAGLRATPCRVAVLQRLSQASSPLTHREMFEALREEGFDKSTIFRSLNDLADARLARRLELGDHVWRYEALSETTNEHHDGNLHPHLLCVDCGSITCLDDDQVEINISGTLAVDEILLKGHCPDCHP